MGRLTTHVLDTHAGRPAAGLRVELYALVGGAQVRLADLALNADGRADAPLLQGQALARGPYELRFHVGAYFAALGVPLADPPFLDVVPVAFGVADPDGHYHVPLLVSPWAYSTYRGS